MTAALVVALGLAGTVIFLTGLPLSSPVPVVYGIVAVALAIWATVTRRWSGLGYRRVSIARGPAVVGSGVAAAVLLLALTTSSGPVQQGLTSWTGLVGFVLLVAFVEETLFRGVFVSVLRSRGVVLAVVVSATAFAFAHAVNVLGGESTADAVRQVAFALGFGLVAAVLYVRSGSLWPSLVFHAAFDLIELGSRGTSSTADWVMTVLLFAAAAWLVLGPGGLRSLPRGAASASSGEPSAVPDGSEAPEHTDRTDHSRGPRRT
jgi:hypothetical protein